MARTLIESNRVRYQTGEVVDSYLNERFHRRRLDIALEMARTAVSSHPPDSARILEIGPSERSSRYLSNFGELTCLDLSQPPRWFAQSPPGTWVTADAGTDLPFRSSTFDLLLAGEIIEHLYDPVSFLHESRRVLRPAGTLVLTTPNLLALRDRARCIIGRQPSHVDALHQYRWLHIRPFSLDGLLAALRAAGLTATGVASNYIRLGTHDRWLVSAKPRFLTSFGGSLIVSATPGEQAT